MKPTLLVANKNYSSWSLRAWLALRRAGIDFDEQQVFLDQPDTRAALLAFSPAGKAPALRDGALLIWDSLAICEYAAEKHPALWPDDAKARAVARSIAAEMHAGFQALRQALPMNLRATGRKAELTPAVLADIDRIEHLWADCRARFGESGPWLFGRWSVADAMYTPVATRFVTYDVRRPGAIDDYVATVFGDADFREWRQAALAETQVVAADEAGAV
jgi:glutathione S-transferase